MEMGFCFLLVLFSVLLFVSAFWLFCSVFCCCSAFLLFVLKVSRYKTWEIHSFILISDFACFVMLPLEMHSSFLNKALTKESPINIASRRTPSSLLRPLCISIAESVPWHRRRRAQKRSHLDGYCPVCRDYCAFL